MSHNKYEDLYPILSFHDKVPTDKWKGCNPFERNELFVVYRHFYPTVSFFTWYQKYNSVPENRLLKELSVETNTNIQYHDKVFRVSSKEWFKFCGTSTVR
jgi:hypothetical protein